MRIFIYDNTIISEMIMKDTSFFRIRHYTRYSLLVVTVHRNLDAVAIDVFL